jgi:hypothetical protein
MKKNEHLAVRRYVEASEFLIENAQRHGLSTDEMLQAAIFYIKLKAVEKKYTAKQVYAMLGIVISSRDRV